MHGDWPLHLLVGVVSLKGILGNTPVADGAWGSPLVQLFGYYRKEHLRGFRRSVLSPPSASSRSPVPITVAPITLPYLVKVGPGQMNAHEKEWAPTAPQLPPG